MSHLNFVLFLVVVNLCFIASVMKKLDYYSKLIKLKDYEIDNLKWSYRGMGTYIQKYNLPEFDDLQIRIKNELNDIDIRKQNKINNDILNNKLCKKFRIKRKWGIKYGNN